MKDARIAELLDELTPRYDDRVGDWERVEAAAPARRAPASRRWWVVRVASVAVVVAIAAVVVLAWPFQANRGGSVLDRALAAVGDGPVVHVVLRGEWGGTVVDLNSGERRPVYGEEETWYDTARGLVHTIWRLGGVVQGEQLYEPKQPPAELEALGRDYKRALETGTAHITGDDTIDGEPVAWVTIHSELLPDVADGKDHEWAQQVAVSRRTFKPVALRETRDGRPGPQTGHRVLQLEFLPAGAGDFSAPNARSDERRIFKQGRQPSQREQAHTTLGGTPLWLGREYRGLKLAGVYHQTTSTGHRRRVPLTGPLRAAVMNCLSLRGRGGERDSRCIRALGVAPIEVGPDGVFTEEGVIEWTEEESALVLFYGAVADNGSTYPNDTAPQVDARHVAVTETTQPSGYPPGTATYVAFMCRSKAPTRTRFLLPRGV